MMEQQFWFYLEPYVYLACRFDDCLFYNTLDGRYLLYRDDPDMARLARRLLRPRNMSVIRLRASDLKKPGLSEFLEQIRDYFMGDLINAGHSQGKPVLMKHSPKNQKDVKRLKKEKGRSIGEGILEYLSEVSVYINGDCHERCPGCEDYCKQFLCCARFQHHREELELDVLSGFLDQLKGAPVSRINILGGNILLYSGLGTLVARLEKNAQQIAFFLHYLHLADASGRLELLNFETATYHIMVTPPYSTERFAEAADKLRGMAQRTTFVFVVCSNEDMAQAEQLIDACGSSSFVLKPFFDGNNADFFQEHVFLNLEDIFSAHPTQKEIYANMTLNRLHFGRLVILNNKKVHAALDSPPLGALDRDSVLQILYKEMDHGKTWLKTRPRQAPCRQCVLSALCPPIGCYEAALKRNDLCNVRTDKTPQR